MAERSLDELLRWRDLSPSGKNCLVQFARFLATRSSGEVRVIIHEGGIRNAFLTTTLVTDPGGIDKLQNGT